MAKRAGARVLATASGAERIERLHDLGLDHGIDYTTTDFVEPVRELPDGRGADVIVDSVGGSNLQRSLVCLAYRGRCISFGDAGRESPSTLDISSMRANNQTLVGYFLGAELFFGTRAHAMIARHLDDIAAGALRVVVDRRFPLEQAGEAHAYIESRHAFGRVLLVP
jgi:NADPH2:quinone reductase